MKKIALSSIGLLLAALVSGCVIRHGDFTVLSNRLIDTQNFDLSTSHRQRVTGEDITHIISFIPTGGPPSAEGALDDAFDKSGGDVLTDAVLKQWLFYLPLIYGQHGWQVEGTVMKTRK